MLTRYGRGEEVFALDARRINAISGRLELLDEGKVDPLDFVGRESLELHE